MSPDVFAKWLRRQGHHIIHSPTSSWHETGPRIYQAFPYHQLITPSREEINFLLHKYKAIGLRYSTALCSPSGAVSYHVVYEGDEYDLSDLPKKARYDVRKALKRATVETITFARMATEGWLLRAETLDRQGRVGAECQGWWETLCYSADGLPGFEAWAAILDGELVASLLAFTCDDCCSILYQQSRTDYLKLGVNNALTYVFTSEALQRPDITYLFYGLHSLDAPPSVDKFKFRMNYTAKPVRQRVVFHPWIAPLFNRSSHHVVRQLLRWKPHKPALAKAGGMLRFYLEGQRPLDQQHWPECLNNHNGRLNEHISFSKE